MRQAVFVAGGARYIGSAVRRELDKGGYLAAMIDDLSTDLEEPVRWGPFVEGSIQDSEFVGSALQKFQPVGVVHLAANSYVGESIKRPLVHHRDNFSNSITFLGALARHSNLRIVFSSSCFTYRLPEGARISESNLQCPSNPYGPPKLTAERFLDSWSSLGMVRYAALGYSNAVGAANDYLLSENTTEKIMQSLSLSGAH